MLAPGAGRGGGGPGGLGRGGPQLTAEQQAERDNLPGFMKSNVKIACAPSGILGHERADASQRGGAARRAVQGKDHCPAMWMLKDESHMSEVFSLAGSDRRETRLDLSRNRDS
jgi:hypothetical protein